MFYLSDRIGCHIYIYGALLANFQRDVLNAGVSCIFLHKKKPEEAWKGFWSPGKLIFTSLAKEVGDYHGLGAYWTK